MQQPIFIVGTGRCGSTMVSNLLAECDDILVLSEFFITLYPYAFEKRVLDGRQFWKILSTPRPEATHMFRYGIGIPEYLYKDREGVPPILITTLPFLSAQPEKLFEEVRRFALTLPKDHLSKQYIRLFEWLCGLFKKKIWVERSGSSLHFVKGLRELFPDAKFVHIVRDGRECAMSMSRHNAFRLAVIRKMIEEITGLNPFTATIPKEDRKKLGELEKLLPDRFDVEAFHAMRIPIERFGMLWGSSIVNGLNSLRGLSHDNLLTLRYEEILEKSEEQISRLMAFIFPCFDNPCFDNEVMKRMSEIVQPNKKLTWKELKEEEQSRLLGACKVGLGLLKYRCI